METYFGFKLPKGMHKEFADVVQTITEKQGEIGPEQIMSEFRSCYLERKEPYHFRKSMMEEIADGDDADTRVTLEYTYKGEARSFVSVGNGPIDAVKRGLAEAVGMELRVLDYTEHALQEGSSAQAAAYIQLLDSKTGKATFGVGVSSNITRASFRALFCALNRLL